VGDSAAWVRLDCPADPAIPAVPLKKRKNEENIHRGGGSSRHRTGGIRDGVGGPASAAVALGVCALLLVLMFVTVEAVLSLR